MVRLVVGVVRSLGNAGALANVEASLRERELVYVQIDALEQRMRTVVMPAAA